MNKSILFAPESYWSASPEVKAIVNGCGTSGWKGSLVPDTIYFLDIHETCNIHDWMYLVGKAIADKEEADRAFLNNMLRLVDAAGGCWLLKKLRRTRAHGYYQAVSWFGGPAFWDGKNPSATLEAVPVILAIPTTTQGVTL